MFERPFFSAVVLAAALAATSSVELAAQAVQRSMYVSVVNAQGGYARQWTVDRDYNGHSGLARVMVTATWGDAAGQAVTLSSLYW